VKPQLERGSPKYDVHKKQGKTKTVPTYPQTKHNQYTKQMKQPRHNITKKELLSDAQLVQQINHKNHCLFRQNANI